MDFTGNASVRFLFILLVSGTAQAFPELVRHGYTGCLNCHSSVVGGDILSAYGRVVKNELVTSNFWTLEEKENNALKIKTPDWLQATVNVRTLQYFKESSKKSTGRFMIMQVDADALASYDKWKLYLSLGRYEPSDKLATWKNFLYTPREWIGYENDFLDQERGFQIRMGRFNPAYGVYQAEHVYGVRKNLNFNPGQERVGAEISLTHDADQIVLSSLREMGDNNKYVSENGYIFQYSRMFEKWRLGFNTYRSKLGPEMQNQKIKMDGVFAVIGWDEKWSSIIQLDRKFDAQDKEGRNFFLKVDWEKELGFHWFTVLEYYNPWIEKTDPHTDSIGVGTLYSWLPNFDIQAFYKKEKNTADLNEYQDVLWIILHASL